MSPKTFAIRRHKHPWCSVRASAAPHRAQNVAYGLTVQGIAENEAKERAQRWIDLVGLAASRTISRHSSAACNSVWALPALATDAEILLMDEALALDPLIRTDMQEILLDLRKSFKTIVFITHDLDEALRIGTGFRSRDGEIVRQGDPQDIIMAGRRLRPGLHQGHQSRARAEVPGDEQGVPRCRPKLAANTTDIEDALRRCQTPARTAAP